MAGKPPREIQNLIDNHINGFNTQDYGYKGNIRDLNNVAPRVGFAWNVTGRSDFVIRGGSGVFFGTQGGNQAVDAQLFGGQKFIVASFQNDGKPGFIADPTRGITASAVIAGTVPLPPQTISVIQQGYQMPSTWQSMLGFQKQLSTVMGIDADLVYYRGRNEDTQLDPNVFYDPLTGFPQNPSKFGRPNPAYGPINPASTDIRLPGADVVHTPYGTISKSAPRTSFMFYKHDTGIGSAGYRTSQPVQHLAGLGDVLEFQRTR